MLCFSDKEDLFSDVLVGLVLYPKLSDELLEFIILVIELLRTEVLRVLAVGVSSVISVVISSTNVIRGVSCRLVVRR